MDATAKLDIEEAWLKLLQKDFKSARITDDEMCAAINMVYDEFKYFVDPHTAVAVAAGVKLGYDLASSHENVNSYAILSTASPCKFQESMTEAIGSDGWKKYYESNFPPRAMTIMEKDEVEPVIYRRKPGDSFQSTQARWEQHAIELLDTF